MLQNQRISILGFSGSLRKGSYNTGLLRAAAELLPDGMTLEIFDLAPIPLYNADVEASGAPEAVTHFKASIAAADTFDCNAGIQLFDSWRFEERH